MTWVSQVFWSLASDVLWVPETFHVRLAKESCQARKKPMVITGYKRLKLITLHKVVGNAMLSAAIWTQTQPGEQEWHSYIFVEKD